MATSQAAIRKRIKGRLSDRAEETEEYDEESGPKPDVAFCCYVCHCGRDKKTRVTVQSGANSWPHRACCHNALSSKGRVSKNWQSPADNVAQYVEDLLLNPDLNEAPRSFQDITAIKLEQIRKKIGREETKFLNDESAADQFQMKYTHPVSVVEVKLMRKAKAHEKRPAVVLDLFAGIGSGIVALKRLCIGISKIVHVEVDPVATHVYRENHDCGYNKELADDGIEYVYDHANFEDLEDDVIELVEKFGPFDIIIGGPPCVDYSAVNAYRSGFTGEQGSYMIRMGALVRQIENIQGSDQPVFFLAENVELKKDDLAKAEEVFCTPGLLVDAHYFSPCCRLRHYFTNIQQLNPNLDTIGSESKVDSCLDDGWDHLAGLGRNNNDNTPRLLKSYTFMASPARINADAMRVGKVVEGRNGNEKFRTRFMNIGERELMMGFKKGYVSKPVSSLFNAIQDAVCDQLFDINDPGRNHWTNTMEPKYHKFAGCMPEVCLDNEKIEPMIKLKTPSYIKTPYKLSGDDYAKRLVGNAFSVVVVELLLASLTQVYSRRVYPEYVYDYPWNIFEGGMEVMREYEWESERQQLIDDAAAMELDDAGNRDSDSGVDGMSSVDVVDNDGGGIVIDADDARTDSEGMSSDDYVYDNGTIQNIDSDDESMIEPGPTGVRLLEEHDFGGFCCASYAV